MFLWVTLVMYILEDSYYEVDLRTAIKALPDEIEKL